MSCLKSCWFIHIEFPSSKTKMVPSYCYNSASAVPHRRININHLIDSLKKLYRSANCSGSGNGFGCTCTDLSLSWVPGTLGKMCSSSAHLLLELAGVFVLKCRFWKAGTEWGPVPTSGSRTGVREQLGERRADTAVPASPQQCCPRGQGGFANGFLNVLFAVAESLLPEIPLLWKNLLPNRQYIFWKKNLEM